MTTSSWWPGDLSLAQATVSKWRVVRVGVFRAWVLPVDLQRAFLARGAVGVPLLRVIPSLWRTDVHVGEAQIISHDVSSHQAGLHLFLGQTGKSQESELARVSWMLPTLALVHPMELCLVR